MRLDIDPETIKKTDVSFLDNYFERKGHLEDAFSEIYPQIEHYKLLTNITYQFNNSLILDMGTCEGYSAICLAQNPTNTVISYDIENKLANTKSIDLPNLQFKIMDAVQEEDQILKSANLIFLDIDHSGENELKLSDRLVKIGFKNFLLCDDIHAYQLLRQWFINVPYYKYDLTEFGHWAGTGLIDFNKPL